MIRSIWSYMRFDLGNSTVICIYDTQHFHIICIILYFNIFPFFWALLPLQHMCYYFIQLHRTAGTFTLFICCYLKYICCLQYRYYRDYLRFLFDYIVYSANSTGGHCAFMINIHTCKFTILILGLLWFDLSHLYTIQNNKEWPFL